MEERLQLVVVIARRGEPHPMENPAGLGIHYEDRFLQPSDPHIFNALRAQSDDAK